MRIHKKGSDYYIDLYEYYWANYSQNVASWKDLNAWLQGVVKGATTFYKENEEIGQQYGDKSMFFNRKTGKFRPFLYWFFLVFASKAFLIVQSLFKLLVWVVSFIPFGGGKLADAMLESYANSMVHDLCNVLGEVAVYNVFDPKSKFYDVKRRILDGAVKAVTYLIEKPLSADPKTKPHENELYYPRVIIAGHSLGTQVTYDAINKLNLLINMKQVSNYDAEGKCKFKYKTDIAEQLTGYITFGCPLDKIVFFLRENVPNQEFLRQQFLDNYHEFKQRNLDFDNNTKTNKKYLKASCGLKRMLDGIQWRNYYDHRDYVSGSLDYYTNLTNINCHFKSKFFDFTHSYYWDCDEFYEDIINNFLM